MVVRFGIFLLLLTCKTQGILDLPDGSCHPDLIKRGRIGCTNLHGEFIFDNDFTCNYRFFKDVLRVDGRIDFQSGDYNDPLSCMPNLTKIFVPDETLYTQKPAIYINASVKKMEKFSFHEQLTIYNPHKNQPDIEIHTDYKMDKLTHLKLAALFGSKRLKIDNTRRDGECFLNAPLKYLTYLDDCLSITGDLVLDENLIQPRTTTRLHTIRGCLKIENTNLDYNQVLFLRKIKEITCNDPQRTFIKNNTKMCITEQFAIALADVHSGSNIKKNALKNHYLSLKNGNGNCDGVCVAEDLKNQNTVCETVWGDLYMHSSTVDKLKNVTTIYGRLIIDGFRAFEPFHHLPALNKIVSTSKEPAIRITSNTDLRVLDFPENLEIVSRAQFLIYIDRNLYYRMNKTQFDQLAEKYHITRLNIKHLAENECYFPTHVSHFDQLQGCVIVAGDLHLHGDIGGMYNYNYSIAAVTGCVIVNNTNLTNLDFIRFLDDKSSHECRSGHVITNNKRLCANLYVKRLSVTRAFTGFYRITTHNNKPHCYKTCIKEDVYQGRLECHNVADRMYVPIVDTANFLSSAAVVEHMFGTLSIKYTNLTRINTFSHLKNIEVYGDNPALEIVGNDNLKEIYFPSLKNMTSIDNDTSILIRIRNNGQYIMTIKDYKKLADKYGEDRLDIDHFELEDFYNYGVGVGIAVGVVVGILSMVVVLSVILYRTARNKPKTKKKEELNPLVARSEHEVGNVLPPVEDPKEDSVMPQNQAEYVGLMQPIDEEDAGQATARTAYLGKGRFAGAPKENASMMQKEREANRARVIKSDEEDTKGPITARTAHIGNKFTGNPKENVSQMNAEKEANKGKVIKSDGEDDRGPATAMTAHIGANKFSGAPKDNASRMEGEKAAAKTRALMSKGGGPATARTANIGGKNNAGAVKENASKIEADKKENVGKLENSVENDDDNGPATAITAKFGAGKKFDTKQKGEKSAEKSGDVTAKTGYMPGKKEFTGNIKSNESVMKKEMKSGEKAKSTKEKAAKSGEKAISAKGKAAKGGEKSNKGKAAPKSSDEKL